METWLQGTRGVCPCPRATPINVNISSSPEPLSYALEFVRPSIVRHCQRSSPNAWSIRSKFHEEPPFEGEAKVCINDSGHMSPYMVITLKSLFSKTRSSKILKLGMDFWILALQSLYKQWVDIDLFYDKVKVGRLFVLIGGKLLQCICNSKLCKKCSKGQKIYISDCDPGILSAPFPSL